MDADRFDASIRTLIRPPSRRDVLHGIAGVGLGLAAQRPPDAAVARKKRRHKKKATNPKPNAFGCLDAGIACRGNSANCCSGICQGKKPKRGKKRHFHMYRPRCRQLHRGRGSL